MSNQQTLKDLVLLAVDRHKTSGRQLAVRAQAHGFDITVTTINHLKAGTYKYNPSPETIRAIAWLAGVEDSVAFEAASQRIPGPPFSKELPEDVDHLSPRSRKIILDLARALIDMESDNELTQPQSKTKPHTRLRAVAPEGDPRPGQKTNPGDLGVTEIFGEEARNYPLPNLDQMAAHPNFKSKRQKWEEAYGERGEESQDSGEDL
ncbi:hypothetical protein [Arthrobacter sp. JUb115]|uniref:hypothetical protein n=1 Tax=Arthrobacter sp. JUb115 TaxID=2485108 RepID=UPI001061CF98|nr:hypothetical protein [Arthrobacter sp. JUb115]